MSGDQVRFGRFRLDLGRRELSHDGEPVHLGNRVLDILCVLVAAKGEVVTKDELMARVWPGLDYKPRQDIVHTVPEIPVLIDGVMFDPKDIKRFDGQELHFIAARDRQSMIAITDRAVMGKWWEMTYVTSLTNSASSVPRALASHFSLPEPAVNYYEDDNFLGSIISHRKNRGFADLTQHRTSLFGPTWNDRISSLILVNLTVCVLYENVQYGGATHTFYASVPSSPEGPVSYPIDREPHLRPYGWNDRASSVGGW